VDERYRRMKERLGVLGQEQVLRYWPALDEEGRRGLLNQLEALDMEFIAAQRERAWPPVEAGAGSLEGFSPMPHIPLPSGPEEERAWERARRHGEELLADGAVGVLVVAGGQGTRLGYPGAKGKYPVGPVSGRSLFQFHIEKMVAMERRYGRPLPFYVMTSPANHEETIAFFKQNSWFGKDPGTILCFPQRMLPVFDTRGQLLLESPARLSLSPDGHGGVLYALRKHQLLEDMRRRGIRHLFHFQVDNVLVRIADPAYMGFHEETGAEMSARTVRKRDPWEKLGNIGRQNGICKVIEYSELPEEKKTACTAAGELLFGQGSIAIHLFSLDFLERLLRQKIELPYHIARKKMASVEEQGAELAAGGLNAVKFEQFIFDAFSFAERVLVLETDRRLEFSPIKNREGEDSPATARRDLSELFAGWLEACGIRPRRHADGSLAVPIEISPLYAMSAAELGAKISSGLDPEREILLEEPTGE